MNQKPNQIKQIFLLRQVRLEFKSAYDTYCMTHFSNSVLKDGDAFGYLHENDIIHSINGELVTSTMQFVSAMKSAWTPRVHIVVARMVTPAVINDVNRDAAPIAANLQNMSIRPKQRKSIGKPLSLVRDTPTQIFQPTQSTQITDTQDILEQKRGTQLELTLESSLESYPTPSAKSPISTAQVSFLLICHEIDSLIDLRCSKRNLIG